MGCGCGTFQKRGATKLSWASLGGEVLEPPIREELVKLLDADWLVQLAETGGTLLRRQDLPPEAFLSLDALKSGGGQGSNGFKSEWLRVLVLSHPWLQPGHPDPHGENLRLMSKVIKHYATDGQGPYGVLIDFCALPQAPRTEAEDKLFKCALRALNLFYAHPQTVVLKVTKFPEGYPCQSQQCYVLPEGANVKPYADRGWCYAESAMSDLVKDSSKVLDLGRLEAADAAPDLWHLSLKCRRGRQPPLHPQAFAQELDQKSFTSKKDDFERVALIYSAAFQQHFSTARELDYVGLGWGPGEAQVLLDALRGNQHLTALTLGGNALGSEGARMLAEALRSSSALRSLGLNDNRVGDDGANALATALVGGSALQSMDLRRNWVGPLGAAAFARALRADVALASLRLGANSVGAEGAASLGEALKANTALKSLNLRDCGMGAVGATALAEALRSNGALVELNVGFNSLGEEGERALRRAAELRSERRGAQLLISF